MSSEDKAAVLERSGSSASQPGTAPSSSSSLQSGAHGGSMLGGGAASSAAAASSASSPMSSMISGSNALSSSTAGSPKPWNINELVAGCTALHHAVFYNHLPIVELLVEHRADTNMKNLSGYTPLHWYYTHTRAHSSDYRSTTHSLTLAGRQGCRAQAHEHHQVSARMGRRSRHCRSSWNACAAQGARAMLGIESRRPDAEPPRPRSHVIISLCIYE